MQVMETAPEASPQTVTDNELCGSPAAADDLEVPTKLDSKGLEQLTQSCVPAKLGDPEPEAHQSSTPADAPTGHKAWEKVKYLSSQNQRQGRGLCYFIFDPPSGSKIRFQTTVLNSNGSVDDAMRIARLCYMKFESGAQKAEVEAYRNELYKKCTDHIEKGKEQSTENGEPPKKKRASGARKKPEPETNGQSAALNRSHVEAKLAGTVRVTGRNEDKKNSSINGVYSPIPGGFGDAVAYKKMGDANSRYLFFSKRKSRWKISDELNDTTNGFAFAPASDGPSVNPDQCQGLRWAVFDGKAEGFNVDTQVQVVPFASNPGVAKENVEDPAENVSSSEAAGNAQQPTEVLDDAPPDSAAHRVVKLHQGRNGQNPHCRFVYVHQDGSKFPCQTTVSKSGGSVEAALRIARLCYAKFETGATKEEVEGFKTLLYAKCTGVSDPSVKKKTHEEPSIKPEKDAEDPLEKLRRRGQLEAAIKIEGRDAEKKNSSMNGVYVVLQSGFGGFRAYQKVGDGPHRVLFYSSKKNRWKVNDSLDDSKGGFAWVSSEGGSTLPCDLGGKAKWRIFDGKEKGYTEDPGVRCIALGTGVSQEVKRKRGRPSLGLAEVPKEPKGKRGRPRKDLESSGPKGAPSEQSSASSSGSSDNDEESDADSAGSDSSEGSSSSGSAAKKENDAKEVSTVVSGTSSQQPVLADLSQSPLAASPDVSAPHTNDLDQAGGTQKVQLHSMEKGWPPRGKACAKMLVRSHLRCICHHAYMWDCKNAVVS